MIGRALRDELSERLSDRVRFDVAMARCISLRVGGPADALVTPADREELAFVLGVCASHGVAHTVLGSGFNTLASDTPLRAVVVQLSRFRRLEERPGLLLRAEAGVSHSQLTRFCVERGFSGLEFGAGIPGTLGGWIAMNAGVPEREVKDVIVEIETMSPTGERVTHLPAERLTFTYRALRGLAPGSVLLSALLAIEVSTRDAVRSEVDRFLSHRSGTQPLNVPTCGSVFKNPLGDHAGRLIEVAGLKGHRIGGAEISSVHASFISNLGGATAADVMALIEAARKAVFEATGTRLETEVRILGEVS